MHWNTFFFAKCFRHSLEALQVKDTKSEAKTIMKNVKFAAKNLSKNAPQRGRSVYKVVIQTKNKVCTLMLLPK